MAASRWCSQSRSPRLPGQPGAATGHPVPAAARRTPVVRSPSWRIPATRGLAGLDPATNINGAADQSFMDSIYGELFELGTGREIINDLATGYQFSDGGKTVTIALRHGASLPTARRSTPRRRVEHQARPEITVHVQAHRPLVSVGHRAGP